MHLSRTHTHTHTRHIACKLETQQARTTHTHTLRALHCTYNRRVVQASQQQPPSFVKVAQHWVPLCHALRLHKHKKQPEISTCDSMQLTRVRAVELYVVGTCCS